MGVAQRKTESSTLSRYLNETSSKNRVSLLREIVKSGEFVPHSLVDDLLLIDLPLTEKIQLIKSCDRSDKLAYEDVMTRGALNWDANISSIAIREWSRNTNHLLWWRFEEVAASKPPQRVFHTLLDNADTTGGRPIIEEIVNFVELEELSDATLAVLFKRSLQWDFQNEDLIHFAEKTIVGSIYSDTPRTHCLPQALEYLACTSPHSLENLVVNPIKSKLWDDVISSFRHTMIAKNEILKKLKTFIKSPPQDDVDFYLELFKIWPPDFIRKEMTASVIADLVKEVSTRPQPDTLKPPPTSEVDYNFFAGMGTKKTLEVLSKLDTDAQKSWFINRVHCFIDKKSYTKVKKEVKSTAGLSDRVIADLEIDKKNATSTIRKALGNRAIEAPNEPEAVSRRQYLNLVYNSQKIGKSETIGSDTWGLMYTSFEAPKKSDRNKLKNEMKCLDQVFAPAFFKLVEKFEGCDDMLPLLLDHMNSSDHDTLYAIAKSLVGVNTQTALTHFVKILGNGKVPPLTRIDMCALTNGEQLANYQTELREMVSEIQAGQFKIRAVDLELVEAIKDLMTHQPQPDEVAAQLEISGSDSKSHQSVDDELRKKLPSFDDLHNESKRAFRTALIIQSTIHQVAKDGKVDISPVVDLQFKGLEILFRKKFEGMVYQMVQDPSKVLQRKLDQLGYLRPSQDMMNTFENYVSSLPVVRDIPQFSRYKLNRVLRAIANFRPGRRFTVEGIKSFAFIFLVFGRKNCRYGLENIMNLETKDDEELANFCRDLHLYQDIRNQAVHEGLPPHMIANIDGYWNLTSSILERTLKII